MWAWAMRSSASVLTPGTTCGATTLSTSAARRPASRALAISSGDLMPMVRGISMAQCLAFAAARGLPLDGGATAAAMSKPPANSARTSI